MTTTKLLLALVAGTAVVGCTVTPVATAPAAIYQAAPAPIYQAPPAPVYRAPPAVVYQAPIAPVYQVPPPVVYVAPTYARPGVGWRWTYHRRYGWGWHHPRYGWHRGWR